MPKILWKDILVEIRHSLGRFLSILCIVALGVAFFAGIKASAPDMKHSADTYFDKYNTQDIQVFSTLGLTKEDVDEIKKIKGVQQVQPLFSLDALTHLESSELVYKIFSLPSESKINQIRLVDGRMPQKENECLIEAPSPNNELFGTYEIGDTISLYSGTKDKLSKTLKHTKYKVVGSCYTTRYLSYEKGTSSIGSGKVNGFLFVPEQNIKPDYFTEIDVTVKGAKQLNTYSDEYFDKTDPVVKRIENIADHQVQIRIQKQQDKVDDARNELKEKMDDAKEEIDKAKKDLQKGKDELKINEQKLIQAKNDLNQGWNAYYQNASKVNTNLAKVIYGIRQIEEQEAKIPALYQKLDELQATEKSIQSKKDQLVKQQQQINQALHSKPDLLEKKKQLEKAITLKEDLLKKKNSLAQAAQQRDELVQQKEQLQLAIQQKEQFINQKSQVEAALNSKPALEQQIQNVQVQLQSLIAQHESGSIDDEQFNQQSSILQSSLTALEAQFNQLPTEADLQQIEMAIQQIEQICGPDPQATIQKIDAGIQQIDTQCQGNPNELIQQIEQGLQKIDTECQGDPTNQLEKVNAGLEKINQIPADALSKLNTGINQANQGLLQVRNGISQLQNGISKIQAAVNQKPELLSAQQKLLAAYPQLKQAQASLVSGKKEYDQGVAALQKGKEKIKNGETEIKENEEKILKEKEKAVVKIQKAQDKIDALKGEWMVLDRNSFYSYRDYEACADRMDGIASVFPVFFFLVAALVCMTTMTRMVDEQRNEIGTLKALGYSKFQIATKYLMYAFLASVVGSLLGCAIGMFVFPYIIFNAWNTMYNIESIQFAFQPALMLMAGASVTGITLLATLFSIIKELIEVPSQLMRPKAGKPGKKILLEHIPWLWDKVSFLRKVTIRNIFRYKKRFLMTVIGISGCSALLVAGFGINDSISDIVRQQFQMIYHYDATMSFDTDKNMEKDLLTIQGVNQTFMENTMPISIQINDKDVNGEVHIIPDEKVDTFEKFTSLKNMRTKEKIPLTNQGLYINEKMAQKLNVKVGDTVSFKDTNNVKIKGKVAGIYENYVGHHVYVTQSVFDQWATSAKIKHTYLLKTEKQTKKFERKLGSKLMDLDHAKSLSFYSALQKNFLDMIGSIKMIVVVLVISAAALAFVVLYNLSNVNISERLREIATIKVLGFTEKEVNQYVNRESIILAFIGALLGLFIGIGLHHLIMNLAELDDIMFGRTILPLSFALSFLLTMIFAIFVNYVMRFKLRKIKMVESLKAVE